VANATTVGQDSAMSLREIQADRRPLEITVDGLLLRPWRPEDADAVYRACQDPEIQRWTAVPSPYLREHATAFVSEQSPAAWADGTAAPLGVFDAESGELLGSNGLIWRRGPKAELGYWMAPAARGRGVATRATRAVSTWATEVLGVERLQWRAEIGNHASRLVALRTGFAMEGVVRSDIVGRDDTMVDSWLAALGPGQVTTTTPARLAPGSTMARQAAVFGAPQPMLPLDGMPAWLRPIRPDDRSAIAEMCADNVAVRWTALPVPYTVEHAGAYIRDTAVGGWLRGDRPSFAIAGPDGALCGIVDLSISASDPQTAEIAYLVAPWARGRGYATAGARTMSAWAFGALGLSRIEWRAYVGNDMSRRIAEKAGFTIDGTLRGGAVQRGERRDCWIATRLATDAG
jgi:RimJ/RimL family protein N-acetyltransferase